MDDSFKVGRGLDFFTGKTAHRARIDMAKVVFPSKNVILNPLLLRHVLSQSFESIEARAIGQYQIG